MQATAELQVIPIGEGVSVRKEITRIIDLLSRCPLLIEPHASGTDIQGEIQEILSAIETIHTTLHNEGTVRLISYLKLETRTDKTPTLTDKKL